MNATTMLYFGRRPYDAETARLAGESLAARGYSVLERHTDGSDYVIETNAPRAIALDAKRRARAVHREAPMSAERLTDEKASILI